MKVAIVRHCLLAINALDLAGAVEKEKRDAHDDVVDDAAAGDEREQDTQCLGRAGAGLKEGQEGKQHGEGEAVDGDTLARAPPQKGRCSTLESQTVEGSCGAVGVSVACGEDGGKQQGIHNVGEAVDAEVLHGHDVGRRSGCLLTLAAEVDPDQLLVVVGQYDARGQGTTNEEETETGVDGLESRLDVLAGVLGLGGYHGDVVGAHDVKGSGSKTAHEALETAKVALGAIRGKGVSSRLPVAEAVGVALGVAADHGHKCESEEQKDEHDFANGQPELGFTENAYS